METNEMSDLPNLYVHTKRKEWGVAILAFERSTKRGYQFEDGKLRLFKEGFYDMLKPVDRPADETMELVDQLNRKLVRAQARRNAEPAPVTPPKDVFSLDDQVAAFALMYPDGMDGKRWKKRIRGVGASRRLKRHRDAAAKDLQAHCAEDVLQAALDEGTCDEWVDELARRLDETNLVQRRKHKPLALLTPEQRETFVEALRDLLWGSTAYELRFERWATTVRELVPELANWQLTTGIPALVFPEEQVCVRPSVFKKQKKWMAPQLRSEKVPNAHVYSRYLAMAKAVAERIEAKGLPARDLLDIHDFMRLTLRPKAKKMLAEKRGR